MPERVVIESVNSREREQQRRRQQQVQENRKDDEPKLVVDSENVIEILLDKISIIDEKLAAKIQDSKFKCIFGVKRQLYSTDWCKMSENKIFTLNTSIQIQISDESPISFKIKNDKLKCNFHAYLDVSQISARDQKGLIKLNCTTTKQSARPSEQLSSPMKFGHKRKKSFGFFSHDFDIQNSPGPKFKPCPFELHLYASGEVNYFSLHKRSVILREKNEHFIFSFKSKNSAISNFISRSPLLSKVINIGSSRKNDSPSEFDINSVSSLTSTGFLKPQECKKEEDDSSTRVICKELFPEKRVSILDINDNGEDFLSSSISSVTEAKSDECSVKFMKCFSNNEICIKNQLYANNREEKLLQTLENLRLQNQKLKNNNEILKSRIIFYSNENMMLKNRNYS
ncbi:MAG: hypothetical protein MHMPM18_000652 [Marteilia pararefringens]